MRQTAIYLVLLFFIYSCARPLKEVFENYKINHQKIDSIYGYFYRIKPDSIDLWYRFNQENTLDVKLWDKRKIKSDSSVLDKYGSYSKYDNVTGDSSLVKVLDYISINQKQLDSLKVLLKSVNCISIGYKLEFWDIKNAGGFIEIGYPTNDYYGLDYILMDSIKNSDFLKKVETNCNYKVINNKTLLKYGGPAWGSDCFPDKK
jgi:hypothetical protein